MSGSIVITTHAVERFVERHAPHMEFKEARKYLELNGSNASPLKERTLKGDFQWVLNEPYCILVVKRDTRSKEWVCVTILPEPQGSPISSDEMEILRNHIYDQESSGRLKEETAYRVLSSAGVTNLIRPSVDSAAEKERVITEGKIWNRVVNIIAARFRHLKEQENQQALREQNEKSQVDALRYLINHIKGSELEYLLDHIESIDPVFLCDAFLMPELYTSTERQQMIQAIRGDGQKSVVDQA